MIRRPESEADYSSPYISELVDLTCIPPHDFMACTVTTLRFTVIANCISRLLCVTLSIDTAIHNTGTAGSVLMCSAGFKCVVAICYNISEVPPPLLSLGFNSFHTCPRVL